MAALVVRNLSDEVHRALKERAAANGRSKEAEVRSIIEHAVNPSARIKMGSELAALGKKYGGFDLEIERDKSAVEPAVFE